MTVDDYYTAPPTERPGMLATAAKEAQAMTSNMKPPAAHTHRGKAREWEMDGYHEATKPRRTPTHRGTPRAENIPPWVRMIQAHADQAERNRNA